MLLYALCLQSQPGRLDEFIQKMLHHEICVLLAKNSSDGIHILGQHDHFVTALFLDNEILNQEPALISQIRMHPACRHLPIITVNLESGSPSHDGLVIATPEDIEGLIPLFQKFSEQRQKSRHDFGLIDHLEVHFKTLSQGHLLAEFLSLQYPDQKNALVGMTELLINAVEHGNLAISYEDKTALLANGQWLEEIERRYLDEQYTHRQVHVEFKRTSSELILIVTDQGHGFEWGHFEQIDPRRLLASHGRGIMMAKSLSFQSVMYEAPGNKVTAICALPQE